MGYNALTYTFLVELWPFAVRARGITIFQWWGRCAGFFNQFVNPIGIGNAGWKYYLSYVIWLAFEIVFVYFLFPETSGRTLEELAFCAFHFFLLAETGIDDDRIVFTVFEPAEFRDKQAHIVEEVDKHPPSPASPDSVSKKEGVIEEIEKKT
jgi:hypothetical protein